MDIITGGNMRALFVLLSCQFLASLSFAAGDAGCGLGSAIITKNSKCLQTTAATTNGSTYTQMFGITSGTSNCTSKGFVNDDRKTEYFVEINKDDLSRQMALGHGEKLQVYAQLNGCVSGPAMTSFFEMTHRSYGQIVDSPDVTPQQIIEKTKMQMERHPELKQQCSAS